MLECCRNKNMAKICDECQGARDEIEKELKEGELKEENLTWWTCEKCGDVHLVKKLIQRGETDK